MKLSEKIKIKADETNNQTVIYAVTKEGEKEIFRLNAALKDFESRGLPGATTLRNKEKSTTIQVHIDKVEIWDTNGDVLRPSTFESKEDLPTVINSGYYDLKTDERLIKTILKSPRVMSDTYATPSCELLYVETNTRFTGKECTLIYIKAPHQEKKQITLIYDNKTQELHFGKRSLLKQGYEITTQNGQQIRCEMPIKEAQDAYFAHPTFNLLKKLNVRFTVGFDNRAHLEAKRAQRRQPAHIDSMPTTAISGTRRGNYIMVQPGIELSVTEATAVQQCQQQSKRKKRLKTGAAKLLKYLGILNMLVATANELPQNDKITDQTVLQTRQVNKQHSR